MLASCQNSKAKAEEVFETRFARMNQVSAMSGKKFSEKKSLILGLFLLRRIGG